MENPEIIISEGNRSFSRTCAAAACYLCATVLSGMVIINIYPNPADKIIFIAIRAFIPIIFVFAMGVHYTRVRNLYLDLEGMKYKKEYVVGPVKTGKWITLPEIAYVSVFRQNRSSDRDNDGMTDTSGHNYDVNVWHQTSKHFTIYSSVALQPAFDMGQYLAKKLNVDLLDATVPNDFKWIELEKAAQEKTT